MALGRCSVSMCRYTLLAVYRLAQGWGHQRFEEEPQVRWDGALLTRTGEADAC